MPPSSQLWPTEIEIIQPVVSSVTAAAAVAVPAVSEDDDYGYNETASDVTQCGSTQHYLLQLRLNPVECHNG